MMAWGALIAWPFVTMLFYRIWSLPVALSASLIGGYLLLPTKTKVDFPVLPAFDKDTVPALTALALTAFVCRNARQGDRVLPGWLPASVGARVFLGLLVIGALGTAVLNTDPIVVGATRLPGLSIYDTFALGLTLLMALLPFFLARKVLATSEGQRSLVIVLVLAASAYALPALWETRMSPQLNRQFYGFFPHDWVQHIRGGGFRPIVFLEHGLWLAIFFASATIAAFGMSRAVAGRQRWIYLAAGIWLLGTLVLAKALGALLIVLLLVPVALLMPRRLQILAACFAAAVVLFYPIARNVGAVPTAAVVSFAERIEPDRARSLRFRFNNEEELLEHAAERPIFGWGGWGRNRVLDAGGKDISTTDGRWVILFGQGGWVRYIGEFGLLTWGILALFFRRRENIDPVSIALALALAANLVDLLPNAGMSPLTWMLAGALVGRLEYGTEKAMKPETLQARSAAPTYRRTFADRPLTRDPTPAPDLTPEPAGLRSRRDRTHRSSATLKLRRGDN